MDEFISKLIADMDAFMKGMDKMPDMFQPSSISLGELLVAVDQMKDTINAELAKRKW